MRSFELALPLFNTKKVRGSLETIYSAVPAGSCSGSARCCCESVNCFYSEYLNIVEFLTASGIYEEFEKRAISYWFQELSVPMVCPFLKDDQLCAVYDARPLPCRIFGHLTRTDFLENHAAIADQNRSVSTALFENYGIVIPSEIIEPRLSYCENFCSEKPFSSDDRDEVIDQLFGLETLFLSNGHLEMDEFNLSLTQWFAYERFGRERALQLRISIAQEFSSIGYSPLLQSLF